MLPSSMELKIQQMNQRASHFQLGSSSQNYNSVYGKDYPPKEALQNQVQVMNPFRGSSLRSDDKGSFATTNKTLLRAWEQPERVKLSEDKLKELKNHHFRLGSYNPHEAMTTNKAYHDRKLINGEASKNQEESKNKMRGHNHDFKEQPSTNYCSAYANQFTAKQGQPAAPVTLAPTDNAICFGSQPLPMLTTSGASFTPKEAVRASLKPEPALGVKLGGKSEPMETMNQLYYTHKESSKSSLPESTMRELRNTHFQLGHAPLQYNTESNYYRSTGQPSANLKARVPSHQSGTWDNKQARFEATTTSQRELPTREVKPFERAVQAARNGLELGGHSGLYTTEFKGNYGAPGNPGPCPQEASRKSNVVIGTGKNDYSTENKSSYRTNDLKAGKFEVDIKKLSSEDHFQIGGSTIGAKVTVYQDQHRPDLEHRNRVFHKGNGGRQGNGGKEGNDK